MTLIVTPWISLDPINLPKFVILGTCGFAALGNFAPYLKHMINSQARNLTLSVMAFVLVLILVLCTSDANVWAQIFGAYGRNTGLVAYMGLSLMLISVVFVSSLHFFRTLIWVLISTGIANAIYGMAQWSGNDPINWSNPYNPVVGTLGNPNFVSAHLAIAGLASLALVMEKRRAIFSRFILLANILISLFVIQRSDSSQGLFIFVLGSTVILYSRLLRKFNIIVSSAYWFIVIGFTVVGIFGVLNKGPLASYLYQASVTYRGDYWRAGWKMTLDNPLLGVGLDTYGDWYRFSRTEAAALRRGPDVTSNSAHNVFLDISSSGGFLLLAAYLLIMGLIVKSVLRVLRRSKEFDAIGVGLVSAWLAYVIQSVISINQLGLAIWGWVLGGAIIGYDLYRDEPIAPMISVKKGQRPKLVPAAVVLTGTLGIGFGFAMSAWPMAQDISFRKALESSDGAKIEIAALEFPRMNYYLVYSAQIFNENNSEERAMAMARLAIAQNPRDFNAWRMLVANPRLTKSERESGIAVMKELDPFNRYLDK
jgi:O-antigen ligase